MPTPTRAIPTPSPTSDWRPEAFRRVCIGTTILLAPPLAYLIIGDFGLRLAYSRWILACIPLMTAFGALYTGRTGKYRVAAWLVVATIVGFCLGATAEMAAPGPNIPLSLAAATVVAALFLGIRALWIVGATGVLGFVAIGYALSRGTELGTPPVDFFQFRSFDPWLRVAIGFIGGLSIIGWAIVVLVQRLERDRESAERSEARFRRLFASSPEAHCVVRLPGAAFLDVNESFERLFGFTRAEVVGRTADELGIQFLYANGGERLHALHPTPESEQHELTTRLRRKDGSERECVVSTRREQLGAESVVIASIRDVTDARRMEGEIRALNTDLERRVRERTAELEAFSYTVSHDLRAPLRAIDGMALMAMEDLTEEPARARHAIERVRAGALRMNELIDGLLQLGRVGRVELSLVPLDLSSLTTGLLEEMAATEPDRAVDARIQPGLRAVGDRALVTALLQNLLGNAWKFTRGRPSARIELSGREGADGSYVFCLADDGIGFDAANASRIFEPFQRFHAEPSFEGHGIGLATVARIVRRHGGRIWAESSPGMGARFYFTLG